MRSILLLSAVIFCVAAVSRAADETKSTQQADAKTNLTAPKSPNAQTQANADTQKPRIVFDGETFIFAWDGASETVKIKEFLPAGQTFDRWTRLVAINEYPNIDDPREFAQVMLNTLKQHNPKAGAQLQANDKTGEVVLDFVTWPEDKSYVEFDAFKFHRMEGGGIIGEQFAQRAYSAEDQIKLLDNLAELKKRVLPELAERGLPLSDTQ